MGLNTFILSQSGGSEGLGFAIPSNIVRNVYQQIRQEGHVHRSEIGVYAQRSPRSWPRDCNSRRIGACCSPMSIPAVRATSLVCSRATSFSV